MELFDKKYVYFMWDDSLEGKEGFFADDISVLAARVNGHHTKAYGKVCKAESTSYPFARVRDKEHISDRDVTYRFFYHDLLYKYKVAFSGGKTVQIKDHIHNDWQDILYENILWGETADTGEFRIKSENKPLYHLADGKNDDKWVNDTSKPVK